MVPVPTASGCHGGVVAAGLARMNTMMNIWCLLMVNCEDFDVFDDLLSEIMDDGARRSC